jgi:hypothetical protein
MGAVTFLLLIFIAALSAAVLTWGLGWSTRAWLATTAAFAILLILPVLLPGLLSG